MSNVMSCIKTIYIFSFLCLAMYKSLKIIVFLYIRLYVLKQNADTNVNHYKKKGNVQCILGVGFL